ncbi:manganese efflux pump MntP [Erythrobacter sp. KY5]|uniref:manganese efflux pump MntP n=1 Tax=Erythrobacter sp. KY5 TaxID=2011159 RepID=UPI000DBF014E|nr:manganese efflux pump [Erythrobacter sp. KY5]AWW75825.1 manganese efflux pump MntP [Erythrobacter sp. KY5]
MIEALLLAVALAMDAFAVALAQGARFRPDIGPALRIALVFGFAQGAMAALGWALGEAALVWAGGLFHWIAFALLVIIGGLMLRGGGEDEARPLMGVAALLGAALATSIDALAAGVALPEIALDPPITVALIAGATLALSLAAVQLGKIAGERFGRPAEICGGLILIALGCKIALEHTAAI